MIEEIIMAISEYLTATSTLRKCEKDCEHSPDYYCGKYYKEQEEALQALEAVINRYIDARVSAVLLEMAKNGNQQS